jgi:hypothetical protein
MLRRFLIIWLTVSILGYGMTMAAGVHAESASDSSYVFTDDSDTSSSQHNGTDCDHCCHGIIHLLGLINTSTFVISNSRTALPIPYSRSLHSFLPTSLLRPPIEA